jgi:hypothetical protein
MTDGAEGARQAGAGNPGDGNPGNDEARASAPKGESLEDSAASDDPGRGDPVGGAADGESAGGRHPEDAPGNHGAYAHATPEQLLGEARKARRQARRARHAYWFPLVLFGLLTSASVPFYIQRILRGTGIFALNRTPAGRVPHAVHAVHVAGPPLLQSVYLGGIGALTSGHAAYYWLAAMLVGLAATAVWYRLRGDRVGLRTPSRGFVITGLVLLVLALLIPILVTRGGVRPLAILMPGDLLIRGTFPPVLIGIGLCVLAWAERSVALTVIAAGYLALSLVASLYDIENVVYRLGWNLSPAATGLPNVVLPALVLLLSGAGAWVVQRRSRPRPSGPADAVPASDAS